MNNGSFINLEFSAGRASDVNNCQMKIAQLYIWDKVNVPLLFRDDVIQNRLLRWCEANSVIEILARVQALVCFASEFLRRAMLLLSPPTQDICLSARYSNSEILETNNQKAHWRACVKAT